MSVIVAAPGASFEASLQNAPTGLVGTIGVRIVDGIGGTTTARSTAGIVETPAGSGIYVATLTAPTTAGSYQVVWDTGSVTPSTTAADDLVVASTAPAVSVAADGDLTTLAAVRAYMQTPAADTGSDAVAASLITRASQLIMRWIDRRVAPLDTVDAVRLVPLAGAARTRHVWVGDLSAAPTTLRLLDDDAATVVATIAAGDRLLYPLERQSTDPIEAIRLLPAIGSLRSSWYLEVTGKWGWPAVPADIEHACILTVVTWLRRGVQALSAPAAEGLAPGENRPSGLPLEAEAALAYYRTPGVA